MNILYKDDLPPSTYALVINDSVKYNIENISVNYLNYESLRSFNPCMKDSIFISNTGDIKICQKLDRMSLGNVKDDIYKALMKDEIFDFWEINNYEDPKCDICAKKLMCINCKAQLLNEDITYECINKE